MTAISVVMPAFNVAPFIEEAIASVLAQADDWELIVVDDGSSDGTLALARALGAAHSRVRVCARPHAGLGATLNHGAELARGDFLVFLDADDALLPGALARLHRALERRPEAVLAYGDFLLVDEWGSAAALRNLVPRPFKPSGRVLGRLLARNFVVVPGGAMIRAAALRRAGGFDPDLRMGSDWEAWCRLVLEGPFVYLRGGRVIRYRQRAASMTALEGTSEASYLPMLERVYANPEIARRFSSGALARRRCQQQANVLRIIARKRAEAGDAAGAIGLYLRSLRLDPASFARALPRLAALLPRAASGRRRAMVDGAA